MPTIAKRWTFTFNNYTDRDTQNIKDYLTEDICIYAVVGKEIGEQNQTPHLQGFLHLKIKKTLTSLQKKMGNAHYELARGSDEDNQKYCKKGGDILLEIGTPAPKNGTNTTFTDAHQLAKLVAEGQDLHDLLNSDDRYTRAYDKHMQFVDRMIQINTNKIGEEAFKNHYGKNQFVMYQWQAELYDMLTMTEPDARKIYWYVDTKGGAGKSTFYSLFKSRGNSCARFRSGRPQDIAYVYKRERVVFFDIPRAVSNILDLCSLMEQFKDGEIFSSKYMSEIKCFAPPHVVVFSNHYPPNDVFSDDRLVIKNINI